MGVYTITRYNGTEVKVELDFSASSEFDDPEILSASYQEEELEDVEVTDEDIDKIMREHSDAIYEELFELKVGMAEYFYESDR